MPARAQAPARRSRCAGSASQNAGRNSGGNACCSMRWTQTTPSARADCAAAASPRALQTRHRPCHQAPGHRSAGTWSGGQVVQRAGPLTQVRPQPTSAQAVDGRAHGRGRHRATAGWPAMHAAAGLPTPAWRPAPPRGRPAHARAHRRAATARRSGEVRGLFALRPCGIMTPRSRGHRAGPAPGPAGQCGGGHQRQRGRLGDLGAALAFDLQRQVEEVGYLHAIIVDAQRLAFPPAA